MAGIKGTTWHGIEQLRATLQLQWPKLWSVSLAEKEGTSPTINRFDVRGEGGDLRFPDDDEGREAVIRKLMELAARNTVSDATKFRINFYGPASNYLTSLTIKVEPGTEAPSSAAPSPSPPEGGFVDMLGMSNIPRAQEPPPMRSPEGELSAAFNALAVANATFINDILLPGARQLVSLAMGMANQSQLPLITQLDRLSAANAELTRELSSIRRAEITATKEGTESAAAIAARASVVNATVHEGVGVFRAFMAMKAGLPPAVLETLQVLAADPKLVEALGSVEVRNMLSKPENRESLRELIIGAATARPEEDAEASKDSA